MTGWLSQFLRTRRSRYCATLAGIAVVVTGLKSCVEGSGEVFCVVQTIPGMYFSLLDVFFVV